MERIGEDELKKMQETAFRRVQEMQRRSRFAAQDMERRRQAATEKQRGACEADGPGEKEKKPRSDAARDGDGSFAAQTAADAEKKTDTAACSADEETNAMKGTAASGAGAAGTDKAQISLPSFLQGESGLVSVLLLLLSHEGADPALLLALLHVL